MVIDEQKWQNILKDSEKQCQEIQLEFEQFKKHLLLNRFNQMKIPVEDFNNVKIDSILKYRYIRFNEIFNYQFKSLSFLRPNFASNFPFTIGPLRPSHDFLGQQNK